FGLGNERHCRPLAQGDRHQQQGKPLIWPALFWDGHLENWRYTWMVRTAMSKRDRAADRGRLIRGWVG
ncbi:MAG: hypothetical protein ACJ8AI_19240, partial [Rhodopila sp.]